MLVLRGLLENVLGNYACLRGYANLGDLAKISQTDPSFQRDINIQHKEDITDFYERGQNVFFSEVILAINIRKHKVNFTLDPYGKSILIKDPTIDKATIQLVGNQIKPINKGINNLRNVALKLNDSFDEGDKPFIRIDGNHRLEATEDASPIMLSRMCPFCIILFDYDEEQTTSYGSHEVKNLDKVRQSIIFHNINSKGMNLTPEQAIKGLFEANGYKDDDLERDMGWEYVEARQIHRTLSFDHIQHISPIFKDKERSILVDMIKFLDEESLVEDNSLDTEFFNNCIASANQVYASNEPLKDNKVIFIAIFYFIFRQFKEFPERSNKDNLKVAEAFINWIISNHMCSVVLEKPKEIVEIYNRLHGNEVKIFMAMPYYEDNSVNDYNGAIKEVVSEIKIKNPHINLDNYSIMNNHSPTHNIIVNIFKQIEECHIFIADITNNNANVLYEYGFANGKLKPCILLENTDQKTKDVKSDYSADLRFSFQGYSDLKSNLKKEIESVLDTLGYVINS